MLVKLELFEVKVGTTCISRHAGLLGAQGGTLLRTCQALEWRRFLFKLPLSGGVSCLQLLHARLEE